MTYYDAIDILVRKLPAVLIPQRQASRFDSGHPCKNKKQKGEEQ